MPKFAQKDSQGGLPPKLDALNVYPEQRLIVQDNVEIWLRCKGPVTRVESPKDYALIETAGEVDAAYRNPNSCPYFLDAMVPANSGKEAVDGVVGSMELITDFLTFQLQYPIKIVHLTACSPSLHAVGESEVVIFSGTPYYKILKEAIAVFHEPAYVSFDVSRIRFGNLEEVEAALRWFAKGVAASALVDRYVFYWIAFEILAGKWELKTEDAKRFLECPRCLKPITSCPACGETLEAKPKVYQRILRVAKDLGREEQLIRRLYGTRQMVHGKLRLKNLSEIEKLPQQTQELKALVVDAIKIRLGIPFSQPPITPTRVLAAWSTMWVHGTTKEESKPE